MPNKRRAPVMKAEKKKPGKMPVKKCRGKCACPEIDNVTIIGNPDAAEVLASLFRAVGVKVVTVKERPDTDDPALMLGPLVPDDLEDDDDDTPGGG